MNKKERISVIIPTKNRIHDILNCLESISIQTVNPDEVVIVDQSDRNELKSHLNSYSFPIKHIYDPTLTGLTMAENVGIDNIYGDIVIILDDDFILDKNYINEILCVFKKYPENIGGVTGNPRSIKSHNGLVRNAMIFVKKVFSTIFYLTRHGDGNFQLSGMPTIISDADEIKKCEFLSGCNFAFKREIITEFKFDENMKGYCWGEDDDIAYRISRKYQNYFTPFAKGVHNSAQASSDGYEEMKMAIENHYYLFKKNSPLDFKHAIAFSWSMIGLLTEGIINIVVGIINQR